MKIYLAGHDHIKQGIEKYYKLFNNRLLSYHESKGHFKYLNLQTNGNRKKRSSGCFRNSQTRIS